MLLFCSSSDVQFKYVYFNHTNLAQKTSIHGGCVRRSSNVPADILRLISDVNFDLNLYVFALEIVSFLYSKLTELLLSVCINMKYVTWH